MSSSRKFYINTVHGQIGQNVKNTLCRHLVYCDISTFRGQIWGNYKTALIRQICCFGKSIAQSE